MTDARSPFVEHRDLLFTIAYEILGSSADAEDAVQESWIRWAKVDHTNVENPRAYLASVVTRQALNRLRTLKRRRETYVGPWLPEPLATTGEVADDVELAESVSLAMLVVLETLSPAERAVFVLREVFDFGYDEIAEALDRSNAAVRQVAHRARERVRARRPHRHVESEDRDAVHERFLQAFAGGDVQELMDVLAPGVVLLTDGGGVAQAALRPIVGADKVLRFLHAVRPEAARLRFEIGWVNGRRTLQVHLDGVLDAIVAAHIEGGAVSEIYVVRNPEKLVRMQQSATRLAR